MAERKPTYGALLHRFVKKHGARKLLRPASLHPSLHLAWSMAAARSFYSVGFYAPKPLDHGYYPSRAMDLRRKRWLSMTGFGWLVAKRFAQFLWDNHEALNIDYVIVGQSIISRAKPYWRPYRGDKSHHWHIHVSGWWAGKDRGVSGGPRPGDH